LPVAQIGLEAGESGLATSQFPGLTILNIPESLSHQQNSSWKRSSRPAREKRELIEKELINTHAYTLGCSDFHFFHISGNVSPSLFSLGPENSEEEKLVSLQPFCPNFVQLCQKSVFFRTFQN
jgi:hypothetical protein